MKLSDVQLLLLDILIFMLEDDSCVGLTVAQASALARKNILEGNYIPHLALTTDDELLAVLDFIDQDEELGDYEIATYLNNDDLRVVTFIKYKYRKLPFLRQVINKIVPPDVAVIFCGTITANACIDNGIGSYESDTYAQLTADRFITDLPRKFGRNISVSGHSKGGNLSMYTVLLNPRVSRAISFDGQGFSGEFIAKYDSEIDQNKHKIVSISAQNDPVSAIGINPSENQNFLETGKQLHLFLYHKPNLLLSSEGNLMQQSADNTRSSITDYINKVYLYIETFPKDERKKMADAFVDVMKILLNTTDGTEDFNRTLSLIPGLARVVVKMKLDELRDGK